MSTFWNLMLALMLVSWVMLHGTHMLQVLRGIGLT
jgi:hypothetical protein